MTSIHSRAFSADTELVAQDDGAEEEWSKKTKQVLRYNSPQAIHRLGDNLAHPLCIQVDVVAVGVHGIPTAVFGVPLKLQSLIVHPDSSA